MSYIKLTQSGYEVYQELKESIDHITDELGVEMTEILTLSERNSSTRMYRDNLSLLKLLDHLSDDLIDRSREMEMGKPKLNSIEYKEVNAILTNGEIDGLLGSDLLEEDLTEDVWGIIMETLDWDIFRKEYFLENKEELMKEMHKDDLREIMTCYNNQTDMNIINFTLSKFQII